jgi:hypothetical protein
VLSGAIIAAVEVNALVGTQGATKKPLDSIAGVIHAGLGLTIVLALIISFLV